MSAKNSVETEKSEHCRTPDAGRLMAKTTSMDVHQTGEQQAAQIQPRPCTREVEDATYNPA